MKKIKVKPSLKGLKVINPKTSRHLSENGEEVERSSYWIRRIKSGDVLIVQDEIIEEKKKQSKKSNSDIEKKSEE